jgi:hypothetical protein
VTVEQLSLAPGDERREMRKTARLSEDGVYRYELTRVWDRGPLLGWILLNPSTADADIDDPTIRRLIGFTRSAGLAGLIVVNLFALRSPDPKTLRSHPDPVGPSNDEAIVRATLRVDRIVAAWGADAMATERADAVRKLVGASKSLLCLGTTNTGAPRHPLYVRGDTSMAVWPRDFPGKEAV